MNEIEDIVKIRKGFQTFLSTMHKKPANKGENHMFHVSKFPEATTFIHQMRQKNFKISLQKLIWIAKRQTNGL